MWEDLASPTRRVCVCSNRESPLFSGVCSLSPSLPHQSISPSLPHHLRSTGYTVYTRCLYRDVIQLGTCPAIQRTISSWASQPCLEPVSRR